MKAATVSDPSLQEKTLLLGEILSLLRERSKTVMDEADTILHNRSELHFTSGEGKPIDAHHRKFIHKLYSFLALDPEMVKLLQLSNNKQVSQMKENDQKIKDAIVKHFENEFCTNDADKALFRKYVLGDKSLKTMPHFINAMSNEQKELIALLKGQLCTLLDVTLLHEGYRDYAFSKENPTIAYAIPAHCSRPVEGSECGNHFEAINYTFQLALQAGIPETVVDIIVRVATTSLRSHENGTATPKDGSL